MISGHGPIPAFGAYGVELEYMIVSGTTLDVAPLAPEALRLLSGSDEDAPPPNDVLDGNFGWSNELVCHLVELKNPAPAPDLGSLGSPMAERVGQMNRLLGSLDARLMPGGMHPWMEPGRETVLWSFENAGIYAAYDRIFNCRTHGWANMQSQHLNLPFADDVEFARLHAAVRLILPIVPALAASSPFVDGRSSGYVDTRLLAYCHHADAVPSMAGEVIPETAYSRAQYEDEVLGKIYADLEPVDSEGILRFEWANARGAIPRFDRNALEIRVLDGQEYPLADIAIAQLVAGAARYLFEERSSSLDRQQSYPTQTLKQILVDCAKEGERTRIGDASYLQLLGYAGSECSAAQLWAHLTERIAAVGTLDETAWPRAIEVILNEGPLARRLSLAAGPSPDRRKLHDVYRKLCDCLAGSEVFRP